MKDYETLAEELVEAKAEYHDAANTLPAPKLREMTDRIDAIQAEIVVVLSEGADPCPDCQQPPHAMHKAPGVFEMGCLNCEPKEEPRKPDQDPHIVIITKPCSRAATARAAVKAWNEGKRVQKAEKR